MDLACPPETDTATASTSAPSAMASAAPVQRDEALVARLRLALQHFRSGDPVAMAEVCRQGLEQRAGEPDLMHLLGLALHLQGRSDEALPWMERATAQRPDSADMQVNLGEVLRALQRWPQAEAALQRGLALEPGNAEALNNLGLVLQARGRWAEAEQRYRAALAVRTDHAETLNNLGTLLQELGRSDEAEQCYRDVLARQPQHRNALNNLATIVKEAGRFAEAGRLYEQILAIDPGFWRTWNSLGQLHKELGDHAQALACYDRALALAPGNPDTLYNIALADLLFGELERGFAGYEVRYHGRSQNKSAPKPPDLPCPMWQGEPLAGRHIALVREQGLGDQLQFCRYAAQLRDAGAEVTLIVDGPLVALLRGLDGPTRVIAPGQMHEHAYDCWAFLLSLPHRLGTRSDTVPAAVPYLHAPAALAASWRQRLDRHAAGRLRVGLVWAGNKDHANNRNRSTSLDTLAPLLALDPDGRQIAWVSLQKGEAAEALRGSGFVSRVLDLDEALRDFTDTAAIVESLDLLISVDTSIVHLAGALNRPAWVLVAHGPDWRWLRETSHSAWYPSLRLFRQRQPRDWAGVIDEVATALRQRLAAHEGAADRTAAETLLSQAIRSLQAGQPAEAEASALAALAIDDSVDGWHLRALALKRQQRGDEARAAFEQALARCGEQPFRATVLGNFGHLLRALGDEAAAEAAYREATRRLPGQDEHWTQLGNSLTAQGRPAEAEAAWREGLTHRPDSASLHNVLAAAAQKAGRLAEAEALFRRALQAEPLNAPVLYNLAGVLNDSGRLAEAIDTYQAALAIDPDYVNALTSLLRVQQNACDWSGAEASATRLRSMVASGTPPQPVFPFAFLAIDTSRAEQRRCAQQWVAAQYRPQLERARTLALPRQTGPRERLRIGYLSSDLHNHATAYLMAEVFERHDRSKVEVVAYSCGADDGREMRTRIRMACDAFHDVAALSVEDLARRIHADGIDILVDLKGYTRDTRSQVLALRPAPVQVSHLGYPGTLGDPFADYVLGDPIVTPLAHASDYDERIAQLPDCYQPNDRHRRIGERPERAALGLPEDAVVLACFNHNYKITRPVFARWCRILKAAPRTVLWLLRSNPLAEAHLRQALAAEGLDDSRLVFGGELPLGAHLGRLQQADLSLDTEPYNAHTTASDALWAGVPVITRTGETFASRVATSLVGAAGLPELAVRTEDDYVELTLALVHDTPRRLRLREHLTQRRETLPLFDAGRFTVELEALYRRMWARAEQGLPPVHLPAERLRPLTAQAAPPCPILLPAPETLLTMNAELALPASSLATPSALVLPPATLVPAGPAALQPALTSYRELLIGCGGNHAKKLSLNGRSHWTELCTLDINPDHRPDMVWDLTQLPLPYGDDEFNEIHAYEVLEHTGAQGDFRFYFAQFSEFWRILRPGGVLIGTCPSRHSPWAWGDPSHTRIIQPEQFIFLDQMQYIAQVGKTAMSDFRWIFKADFSVVHSHDDGQVLQFALRAVKPSRIPSSHA